MSVRGRVDAALMVLATIAFLPGRLVEEGIHALAALPFAERVSIRLNPRVGTAKTVVQYHPDPPGWAIATYYLAPQVVGTLAGIAVVAWWIVAGPLWYPATTIDWILLCLLGAQYLAIVVPSSDDLDWTPEGGERR